jgi:hypothetical protein
MNNAQAGASCTLTPAGTVTNVPVKRMCSVTYTFDTKATQARLAIPYAVALNGIVLPEHEEQPRCLGDDRKIKLTVLPGAKVALYLNSDARQGFRTLPVYGVEVGTRDVDITITERLGRGNTETGKLPPPTCTMTADGKRIDRCDATLTGDIWMKISHRYTREEANEMMPADTDPTVRAAVLSIYAPLTNRTLTINFPATSAKPAQSITMTFEEQPSVSANTSYCPLLSHVLTRTHPKCYLALITEARAAGITKLCVNSAWRPSFGSIVHRAGLGLDVYYIEASATQLSIERRALTSTTQRSGANVGQEEKELYVELTKKDTEATAKAKVAEDCAKAARKTPSDVTLAEKSRVASDAAQISVQAADKTRAAWYAQVEANQPAVMKSLRSLLSAREDVTQIIDPWYVELQTHDKKPAKPNEQRSSLEQSHNNHLHITIKEPKIYESKPQPQ